MPFQNRVTPHGEIEFSSARGLFMGNRGILHDGAQRLGRARWRHKNWVCCLLEFKGRKQTINPPSHYTQLFFLDEAVALAAGHRPCGECRRLDHRRFAFAWQPAFACDRPVLAKEMDAVLHPARTAKERPTRHARSLPDGSFVDVEGQAFLIWKGGLHRWSHEGYSERRELPDDEVRVLTPLPIVRVLSAGYQPVVHASADT
ncbi:hypothetical protein [Flaviflagellibacter deserti]|jgi:hypothetical protein|uniref:Uncharacterized protein n=1 Tax=Flaviflagellibacter deserti TaxID=2267266 RepID=A0ABV9Z1H4_9HYPH